MRNYSFSDRLCLMLDGALRTLCDIPRTTGRAYPAANLAETIQNDKEKKHAAACMRINHAGEVAAQGLYHGQALVSRTAAVREKMRQAALEEGDHLAFCRQRLLEMGRRRSLLVPCWYTGSFLMGVTAGLAGDQWSLGFLAETETQVTQHLQRHLDALESDAKTTCVLKVMQEDEVRHHAEAIDAGAVPLPASIKKIMHFLSAMMVKTAYWI